MRQNKENLDGGKRTQWMNQIPFHISLSVLVTPDRPLIYTICIVLIVLSDGSRIYHGLHGLARVS